jgi:hypothetical protein
MAPKRYSIYASPALDRVLADRIPPDVSEGDSRSRSSMLSAIADRYAEIIRRAIPELSEGEWKLIFDVMNGCWTLDQPYIQAQGLSHQIADGTAMDGLGEKWDVDGLTLARRVADLPLASQLAIIDTAERFWSLGSTDGEEWPTLIARLTGRSTHG